MNTVLVAALPPYRPTRGSAIIRAARALTGWWRGRRGCLQPWPRTAAVCLAAALVIGLLSDPAMAEPSPAPGNPADIPTVINNLRLWLVGLLAGVATLFLTIGGLRYLAAGGDPSEVERSKGALKAAAIGYAIAILAPVLLAALQGIVGS
ncbi:MAG: pilin [Micromonosporaceae bacterium]